MSSQKKKKENGKKHAAENKKNKIKQKNQVQKNKKVQKGTKKKVCTKPQKFSYDSETVKLAIIDVNEGSSLRRAAQNHGIPVSSLYRAIKNPNKPIKAPPPTILTVEEENDIVKWIEFRAESGYPATKSELLDNVQNYILKLNRKTPFTNGRPGRHWYEAFQKRHKDIATRTAQHLTLTRALVT